MVDKPPMATHLDSKPKRHVMSAHLTIVEVASSAALVNVPTTVEIAPRTGPRSLSPDGNLLMVSPTGRQARLNRTWGFLAPRGGGCGNRKELSDMGYFYLFHTRLCG